MIALGVAVAAVAAFVLSSVYYAVLSPLEAKALRGAAIERGRPAAWKVAAELARTAVVAAASAWIASRADLLALPDTLLLALVIWVALPVVLLTGSVVWEGVRPVTAALHAGDWLLKLLLVAVVLGLLH